MKKVIAELNAAATYDEQYTYLYRVTEDVTYNNLLELYPLVALDVPRLTKEQHENLLALITDQLRYLYNNKN